MKISILILIFTLSLSAQSENNSYLNKILVGGDIGVTLTSSDYSDLGSGLILRGVAEYYFFDNDHHSIGFRGYGAYGISSGSDTRFNPDEFSTNLYMLAAGGIYNYKINSSISPYAFLGIRYLRFNPKDSDGNTLPNNANGQYDRSLINIAFEVGLRFIFSPDLHGYSSLTPVSITNDYIDDRQTGAADDFVVALNFGLLYAFDSPWSGSEKIPPVESLPEGLEHESEEELDDSEVSDVNEESDEMIEDVVEKVEPLDESAVAEVKPNLAEVDDTEVEESNANIIRELTSKLELGVVNFDYGKTELDRMEYVELDRLYDIIAGSENRWKIVGHTDNVEPTEIHQSLAIQRAYFVMRYFMGKGIERDRFEVVVQGEEDPIADNSTPEGRAKNRRVEVVKMK